GLFLFGVFAPVAFDLDDQVEGVCFALAIIDLNNKVRAIFAVFGGVTIGDFQPQVMVFYISQHFGVGLCHAAEFGFPIAIQNYPVELAAAAVGFIPLGIG